MFRVIPTDERTTDETPSKNFLGRQSGKCAYLSVSGSNTLTPFQKQVAEQFHSKAVSVASILKRRIRQKRWLSSEEEEQIDNLAIDLLTKLSAKITTTSVPVGLFEIGFSRFLKWGEQKVKRKMKKQIKTVSLYDEDNKLRFDKVDPSTYQDIDALLEELDIPHRDKIRRLLQGESISSVFPTEKERKQWQRTELPKIRGMLSKIYNIEYESE